MIAPEVAEILCCPACGGALSVHEELLECASCEAHYGTNDAGVPDLRLPGEKSVAHQFLLGRNEIPSLDSMCQEAAVNPNPTVDFSAVEVPLHFSRELLSHFPRAGAADSLVLDLGCGDGVHREICRTAGYRYVGVDIESNAATCLADAHSLPFGDESFDFVLSMAVLEHLQYPLIATREIHRVLKPGGIFLGTVAFQEPFHGNSFYHHTHLGTANSLQAGGLEVEFICPGVGWPGLYAIAKGGLYPKMPAIAVKALVSPLLLLHRLWWKMARWLGRDATSELDRERRSSGSFYFKARKS